MKKKISTFLILLFLSSCGYEAQYSLKNRVKYNFSIEELVLTGDRLINLKIKQQLRNYTNPKTEEGKIFVLEISSESEKIITAKNAAGDATKFKNEIEIRVEVFMDKKPKMIFVIKEDYIYDSNSNTFELTSYENQIKNNLTESAVDKIISKLADIT